MANNLIQLKQQLGTVNLRLYNLKEDIGIKMKEGDKLLQRQQELKLKIMELENG